MSKLTALFTVCENFDILCCAKYVLTLNADFFETYFANFAKHKMRTRNEHILLKFELIVI